MKILWLSHLVPYPPKAGVLLRAYNLIRELARYHEVHLLAFNQRNLITPYFGDYVRGTETARAALAEFCARVEFIDCPTDAHPRGKLYCALRSLVSSQPYNMNWLRSAEFARRVQAWAAETAYDLVHCDTISLAPYSVHVPGAARSLDHHNVESHMLVRRAALESNWLRRFYFWQEGLRLQRVERHWCPRFDTNITCSELDSERFRGFCPDARFTVIPNGVDIEAFRPSAAEPGAANFLFIGTLDWYPNARAVRTIARDIWPRIRAAIPAARMDIIGANPPAEVAELGRRDERFAVHGFVDRLEPFLERATAYLCPIDDGGGTKLKLLDAFAAGKAVIAHPVACEGLAVEDGKQVLFARTADEYLAHIQDLMARPERRRALEGVARQHVVDHFAYRSIGERLSAHFGAVRDTVPGR